MKGGFNLAKLCENRWVRLVLLAVVVYLAYNYFFVKREGAENIAHAFDGAQEKKKEKEALVGAEDDKEPEAAEEAPADQSNEDEGFRNLTAWA